MVNKNPLTASELGMLWFTYQEKTLILRVLEYFQAKSNDKEARNIMGGLYEELNFYLNEIKGVFENEGVAIRGTFSEKLMMTCVFLLNGFGLVGSSFGTIFSLRNDMAMKLALLAKDVFLYGHEGVKILIKHGWLEEPPQMEDRPRIINRN